MVIQNSLTFLRGTRAATASEMLACSPSMGTPLFQQTSLKDKGFLQKMRGPQNKKILSRPQSSFSEFFRDPLKRPWSPPHHEGPDPIPLITDGLIPFAHQPWVDIPRPPAFRNVTGHIAEATDLLTGRTVLRRGLGLKGVIIVGTLPMGHWSHLIPVLIIIRSPQSVETPVYLYRTSPFAIS